MGQIRGFRAHSFSGSGRPERGSGGDGGVARARQVRRHGPDTTPLRDYGVIGDMRTAALVSRDGSIDWCCFPRFDSPSVFARILDARRGGSWSVRPARTAMSSHVYEEETNVLTARFEVPGGRVELTDFMPTWEAEDGGPAHREIHRRVLARAGSVDVEVRFRPRFDYARRLPRFHLRAHGLLASDRADHVVSLATDLPLQWRVDEGDGEARARFALRAGEARWLVLRWDDDEVWEPETYRSEEMLERTRAFWRGWTSDIRYDGAYRAQVERSALALKLLSYAPSGTFVAAPTTSLPEQVGGVRNWDYRYSWLRDSTYTLFGLYALRKFRESDRYMAWLKKVCRQDGDVLQVLYGVEGERRLPEGELPHLEGYGGSRPVRVGNGAMGQFQLDVYGEILDSIHIWRKNHPMTEGMWELCRRLVRRVMADWRRPDCGVWEVRCEPRHFVFSKVMCWVAMDRAIRAAEELGLPADLRAWRACRREIRREILTHGWSERQGAFVQHYGSEVLDAANLLIPILRFLPHSDPRVRTTTDRIVQELSHPSGLLYRYRGGDGVEGSEGAFCVNTFHLAQALALRGDREAARETFETMLSHASPLGLLSEEVDPDTGVLLGNFPQAFSHIGLINAAHVLARTREARLADDSPLLAEA